MKFIYDLYGKKGHTSACENLRLKINQGCESKIPLPRTSPISAFHMKRVHLQVMVWKAADKIAPPTAAAYIRKFGWEVRGGVVSPANYIGSPAPAQVMRELSCGCRLEQVCIGEACCFFQLCLILILDVFVTFTSVRY